MSDLAAENARLRAQLVGLDRSLRAIEDAAAYAARELTALVASFEGDPAHERVALAVQGLAENFADVFGDMAGAIRSTNH